MNSNKTGNYYHKSSFALKISRYLVILLFIIFLISCTLIYRNDITVENIQFLAKYITLNDGSSHYYKDEFPISASKSSDIFMLRDNVAIVDKSGIALYELSGSKLFNYSYSYSSPACVRDTHNILIHDIKGNELSIFNSFSRVFSQKYPYSVKCADINEKGFAVITGEKGYRSALIVYNDSFKEQFRWLSEENYLSAIALSPSGNTVAVSAVKSENGLYNCCVKIFDISKEDPVYTSTEFDELPLNIKYSEDGKNLYVITDSGIHFYDLKLNEISYYKFNQSKIEKYYTHEDMILLCELNNLSGNSVTVIALDFNGNKLFEFNINDTIHDIALGSSKIFALGTDCIYKYEYDSDKSCKLESYITLNEQYNSILCDSEENCYVTNESSVIKVNFNKDNTETENK